MIVMMCRNVTAPKRRAVQEINRPLRAVKLWRKRPFCDWLLLRSKGAHEKEQIEENVGTAIPTHQSVSENLWSLELCIVI